MLDLALTPFSILIITVIYPIYFKEMIVGGGERGDFLWGLAGSVSMAVVAVLSPFLGALGDATGRRRELLAGALVLCLAATLGLPWTGPGGIAAAILLVCLANIGYQLTQSLYNAFMPIVARPERLGWLSGWGFAFGYLGALLSLGLAMPFVAGEGPIPWMTGRWIFAAPAGFLLLFGWPFFVWVPEGDRSEAPLPFTGRIRATVDRVFSTLRSARQIPSLWLFLLAYFLFFDGVQTTVFMSSLYARTTIGFSFMELGIFFALIQVMAFCGAAIAGALSDRYRAYPVVFWSVAAWIVVMVLALVPGGKPTFFVVGGLAGILLGSVQVAARAYYARLIPVDRRAEFFGFYNLVGRTSAVLGPMLFGTLSLVTGHQRWGMATVALLFLGGLAVLTRIPGERRI